MAGAVTTNLGGAVVGVGAVGVVVVGSVAETVAAGAGVMVDAESSGATVALSLIMAGTSMVCICHGV